MAALKTKTWKFGSGEADSDDEDGRGRQHGRGGGRRGSSRRDEDDDGLAYTISYGTKDTTAIGSAAQEAQEDEAEEMDAQKREAIAKRREAKEAEAASRAEEAERERIANMAANLTPWARGGARSAEMAGSMTVQSDCLASDGGDTLVCVGGDGESTAGRWRRRRRGHWRMASAAEARGRWNGCSAGPGGEGTAARWCQHVSESARRRQGRWRRTWWSLRRWQTGGGDTGGGEGGTPPMALWRADIAFGRGAGGRSPVKEYAFFQKKGRVFSSEGRNLIP